ncbi:conserved hypothetical protein [uncultured Alphaproteobacteria bacterium]|uniref:Polymer-forming cytoskeletal protein n=1 Tax=uncultured Alphaproteobacteria bacterium TaxID=91750 RepID=A0A212KAG4_9PROT|nr:conserved hypothetical protein [uncultured Alphaproteobacteria bacterium]
MFRLTGLGPARDLPDSEKPVEDSAPAILDTAPPLKPFSAKGTHMPPIKTVPPQSPLRTELPRRIPEIPGSQRKPTADSLAAEGKKLVVGRDIRLSGAICSCDCLVVEGTVEADLSDTRTIVVARGGTFSGTATVTNAEISGLFEGELTVADTVTVRQGGVVKGRINYAHMVMDRGATVEGTLAPTPRKSPPVKALIGGELPEAAG